MKRFSEQLKKQADGLRMSAAEKSELRSRIVSYMEYHPIPGSTYVAEAASPVTRVRAFFGKLQVTHAASAFVVIVLASIPMLAQNAMPGDVLYPVKVRINEEVRSSLARSSYEKIEWETERLERRLAEARLLASEGKLTPEVEARVADAVRAHSKAAQKGIATLRASDSDEAAIAEITLASALDVQSEILGTNSSTLADAVDTARQVAMESRLANRPSYEKLLARIENETTRAYELFSAIEHESTERERDEIGRRMREIERRVAKGIERANDNSEEVIAGLTTDLTDLRKLISFMTDLDVRSNVTIDELVPETMTDEERFASAEAQLEEIAALAATIRERMLRVDANTARAVESRLEEVSAHTEAAESAIERGEAEAALQSSETGYAIIRGIIAVLDQYDAEMGTATPSETPTTTATTTPLTTSRQN